MAGKNAELKIRMTAQEKNTLQKRADELNIPISAYVRMVALNSSVEIKIGKLIRL